MGEIAILGLAVACAGLSVRRFRTRCLTFVFWAMNAYILALVGGLLTAIVFTDLAATHVSVSFGDLDVVGFAWLAARCCAGFLLGEYLVNRCLIRTVERIESRTRPQATLSERIAGPLLASLAVLSLIIGAGSSYEDYVAGSSIGWGVTFLGLAVAGVALAMRANSRFVAFTLAGLVVFSGAVLASESSIRTLVALPVLGLLVELCFLVKQRKLDLNVTPALLIAVLGIGTFISISLERAGEPTFPEAFTVGIGLALFQEGTYGQKPVADEAVSRLIGGLVAYPAAKLGAPILLEDAASSFAHDIMGPWAVPWAHFPASWFLDLLATSRTDPFFDAVLLGIAVAVVSLAPRLSARVGALFVPSLVLVQVFCVRGAIWTGATSVSAVLAFLCAVVALLLIAGSVFRGSRA